MAPPIFILYCLTNLIAIKMAEEKQNLTPNAKPAGTKTVARRGVASARGTQILRFHHTDANSNNGLFEAHLDKVEVSMIKIGEDTTGMPSFNGLEIPRLTFIFASNEANIAKRKYAFLRFMAAESNTDNIPGGKSSWKVDSQLDWIKHLIKVYITKDKEMEDVLSEEQIAALDLPFTDFDEEGKYVPISAEDVIAGWKAMFDNIATIFNTFNNGTPAYMKDGKFIPVWIKLLRCTRSKSKGWVNVSNGDLVFPSFVGQGCVEFYNPTSKPTLKVDIASESIIPRVSDKPKQPTAIGGAPIGGMMAGVVPDGGFAGMPGEGIMGVPSDMPFDDLPD